MWNSEEIHTEWTKGFMVEILQKSDPYQCTYVHLLAYFAENDQETIPIIGY